MNRILYSSMETMVALAHRANLQCVRGVRIDLLDEDILREILIQKYRKGIFITILTRFSREVASYMCEFYGAQDNTFSRCELAVIIGNTSWQMYSTWLGYGDGGYNDGSRTYWAVKRTIKSDDPKHLNMKGKNLEYNFDVSPSYDTFYEVPYYDSVLDALIGMGYDGTTHLEFNVEDDEDENLSQAIDWVGNPLIVWLDQPDALPEWHNRLLA
jgi:hypothetical protein